ncbi:MAG: hypothetical protein HQL63_02280 [Magnetococcales bacterium]|nr:hypothetical protein [Magnetococcales bacterium]MBF0322912.1 hypothetical protein [Magnetococcales bacterium]
MAKRLKNPFFDILKANCHRFDPGEVYTLFKKVNRKRINNLCGLLSEYISKNVPAAFERRDGLSDYRANPYVLMTAASVTNLDDPTAFGRFLFNSKLYMALETSFGKSVEAAFVGQYPIRADVRWTDPPEKQTEFDALNGLSRENRARQRTTSQWREIDRSCVVGKRRFMTSIKSGPNTINDTQVQGMTAAIRDNIEIWASQTKSSYPGVDNIDIVLGLTYGTDRTTNNKENQILVKLLEYGFVEEDRVKYPGVLIDKKTKKIRVYRRIGRDFWSFIGQPDDPASAKFVFLEILLGLARALALGVENAAIEDRINAKIRQLAVALQNLQFSRSTLPEWISTDFNDDQLFWFATALTAFYDEGV